jgi:predicted nuclease of predicted toxin-antitoxin system
MRLLLDENLPRQLKSDFREFEVYTVRDMGWNGIKNGELLKLLIANQFDAFLTFDKNMRHQQNFNSYSIPVFLLVARINRYDELTNLTKLVKVKLNEVPLKSGMIVIQANN